LFRSGTRPKKHQRKEGRERKGREGNNNGGKGKGKGGRKGIITGRIANTPETLMNKGKQPFCCITLYI
jgi:hypothetical protein